MSEFPAELLNSWDLLNRAAKSLQCAQPGALSVAAERLEYARERFERLFMDEIVRIKND